MKYRIIALLMTCLIMILPGTSGCSDSAISDGSSSSEEPVSSNDSGAAYDFLPEGFIKGMDVSSVISLEQSGVVFYGTDGKPQDLMKTLSEAGVNYIRVRVWNDPYDANGNGYGGGNCDAEKAAETGRRAAKYGMKLLVDFHYSDFWADPSRQYAPKAWREMPVEEKSAALYDFTVSSLETISSAGADIGMVQIGNEINSGLAGESDWKNVSVLLQSASKAVRDFSVSCGAAIKIAVHFAPASDRAGMLWYAGMLNGFMVDYDVFGVSYYPYWHGSLPGMKELLSDVKEKYGKQTVVLETAYPYTLEDGDGFQNIAGQSELLPDYPASTQGQADCVRAVMNATAQCGALGVFYWEGAWIPVGDDPKSNSEKWEKYGSGWASSYCAEYDPDNGGKYYGGSTWDNQAFFGADGKPLDSLKVFG